MGCGKQPHLFISGKTAALVPEFAVEHLPSAELQPWFLHFQWRTCPWAEDSDDDGTNGFVCASSIDFYLSYSIKTSQNPWKLHLNFLCRWPLSYVTDLIWRFPNILLLGQGTLWKWAPQLVYCLLCFMFLTYKLNIVYHINVSTVRYWRKQSREQFVLDGQWEYDWQTR